MVAPQRYLDSDGKRLRSTRFDWLEPTYGENGEEVRIKARRRNGYFGDQPVAVMRKPFIDKTTPIFTMGSCFALEIKRHLSERGFNVLSVADDQLQYGLIWYNTWSIRDEIRRVLGEFTQAEDDIWDVKDCPLNKRGKSLFQDPYRRLVTATTPGRLWKRIRLIDDQVRTGLLTAKVIVITLGLTEVFFQTNGNAICSAPGYYGGGGDGANFRATTYDENYLNVLEILQALRKINSDARVILTVSPVPLGCTFRGIDHVIANMESKSILRAVAGRVCQSLGVDNVEYFHSYELVALSQTLQQAFKRDGRHVNPDKIADIMREFERHYVVEEARTCDSTPDP